MFKHGPSVISSVFCPGGWCPCHQLHLLKATLVLYQKNKEHAAATEKVLVTAKDTTFPLIISCYSRNRNFNFSQLSPKGYLTLWSPKSQKQQCLRFAMCINHTLYTFPIVAQSLPWQKTNISRRRPKTGVQDGLEHSCIQIQSQRSPWVVPIMRCVCVLSPCPDSNFLFPSTPSQKV